MIHRSPPKTPSAPIVHSQSESDLITLQVSDIPSANRNKRPRTEQSSPKQRDQDLKQEIMELLNNWKVELDSKLNDISDKQSTLISKLTTDISELKLQTSNIQASNDKISTSMQFINKQYEEIKAGVNNLQKERQEQRKCLEKLERKVQDLQLKSRSSSIEIRNIPIKDKESFVDLTNTICKIGQTIGTNISADDIRDAYRLPGKPGSSRPVFAEFHTVQMKLNTLSSVRNFNNNKNAIEDKLNTELLGIPGKRQAVYVADYLPASSKKLFYLCREFAKQNGFNYCWSSNGNIYLRKAQGDKQILVSSEQCLSDLKKDITI